MFLFGSLLILAGLGMVFQMQRRLRWYREAATWPTVPGEIVHSFLHEKADADGVSYRPEISCQYQVAGKDYVTSSHTEGLRFQQAEPDARAMVASFPVGRAVTVHVNPANPAQAILDTGEPQHLIVIQRIGATAIAIGSLFVLFRLQ